MVAPKPEVSVETDMELLALKARLPDPVRPRRVFRMLSLEAMASRDTYKGGVGRGEVGRGMVYWHTVQASTAYAVFASTPSVLRGALQCYSVLRYFVLRYFVLRYFVLGYFVLRYFVLRRCIASCEATQTQSRRHE